MKMKCGVLSLTIHLVILAMSAPAPASVEWHIQKTLELEAVPLDVAISSKGRWIFVLTEGGDVRVYTNDGRLEDILSVGNEIDAIGAGPREDLLFLQNREDKSVQILALDFIHKIDVSKAPFKGPADAPVVIAIFDDFQ